MKQSAKMTDYLGAKAEMVIQEEAKSIAANRRNPGSAVVDNTNKLSAILRDYRAMRSEERLDAGETQVNVAHHVKAEVDVTQQLDHPFFDVISEIFGDGLLKDARISSRLDPDTLDVSAGDGLVAVLEAALVDDERILDALDTSEQDAEIEE
ncbi:hypothetical protein KKD37_04770 [Patescibacteria group bacterium]|nr:hypothetical protein [Patescibacteria group bacterium]